MADDKANKDQSSLVGDISKRINDFYRRTFFTPPDADIELRNMTDRINKSMSKIVTDINYTSGVSSISTLISKSVELQNDPSVVNGFEKLFTDPSTDGALYNSFFANRALRLLDAEIDMICKYMPNLEEAISTLTDNVLSADHFTKDFIYVDDESITTAEKTEEFYNNIDTLKEKYNLIEFFQRTAWNTSKYGERFVYVVPYKKALERIMKSPNYGNNTGVLSESVLTITESATVPSHKEFKQINPVDIKSNEEVKVNITFNSVNTFTESVLAWDKANKRMNNITESSLNYYNEESYNERTSDIIPDGELDATSFYDGTASSGLIDYSKKNSNSKIDVNGCLQKTLSRYNIIPIYIDEICMGYYYLENKTLFGLENDFPVSDTTTPINSLGINTATDLNATKQAAVVSDDIIDSIAKKLSDNLDAKFINMNKDLTREIYAILKHTIKRGVNDLSVTYLPPDDVIHYYFKLDENTHRGISDLQKALMPAKLYIGLYITNTLATMNRAQDRRVYYVKQSGIDTNISKILLNTIAQIKMQNFNIRQLESMKSVLNIVGRFNDFVIPTDSSGNSPVQFEVMQGQNVDPQTDLMEKLERQTISSTPVPFELIETRKSMDYAIQATMTSSRFLKLVFKRQALLNRFLSRHMTMLYRGEFNAPKAVIKVNLPPPMFLNLTNTNQFNMNANDIANAAMEAFATDMTDEEKPVFMSNLKAEYMKSYYDMVLIERVKRHTRHQIALNKQSDEGSGGGY